MSSDLAINGSTFIIPARQIGAKQEHPAIQYRNLKTSMSINNEEIKAANKVGATTARVIMERTNIRLDVIRKGLKETLVNLAKKV